MSTELDKLSHLCIIALSLGNPAAHNVPEARAKAFKTDRKYQ
ncbi:hypothetical protein ACP179_08465 [Xenorhabdus stockiae]|nr:MULTISPECIES: hypothetical protein [unclassified Xenorhabdus]